MKETVMKKLFTILMVGFLFILVSCDGGTKKDTDKDLGISDTDVITDQEITDQDSPVPDDGGVPDEEPDDIEKPAQGEEGGDCYPNGTCNEGLECVEGVCVIEEKDHDMDVFPDEEPDEFPDDSEEPDDAFIPEEYTVDGFVQKGPFIKDSSIKITELDDNFEMIPATTFTTQTIDDLGNFNIKRTFSSRYILLEATGFYYNEVTGSVSSTQITNFVFVDLKANNAKISINILTTLARRRIQYLMKQGKNFNEARTQSETEILEIFGIFGELAANFQDMDILKAGNSNAMLLAISARLQGNNTPGDLSMLTSGIIYDIETTGKLGNATLKNRISEGSIYIADKLSAIRNNLENNFGSVTTVDVPNFEDYCDDNGNGIINKWEFVLAFGEKEKAERDTAYTSDAKQIKINPALSTTATAKTDAGDLVINGTDTGVSEKTVVNNDTVAVKLISSDQYKVSRSANVVIEIVESGGKTGNWNVTGTYTVTTVECDGNDTRTRPCGHNNRGTQNQSCIERVWVDIGVCDDPDECEDDDTSSEECGPGGLQSLKCVAGSWEKEGPCACTSPGAIRSISCGTNGTQRQNCTDGAWVDDGGCVEKLPDPEFNLPSGIYQTTQNVVITNPTDGTTIRYTVNDPFDPTELYGEVYTGAIVIESDQPENNVKVIKARAYKSGFEPSNMVTREYTVTGKVATPQFSPPTGTYNTDQTVSITTATNGATIKYTLDGTTPNETNGTVYTGAINITATTTLKAMAYKENWIVSDETGAEYIMKMADPVFSHSGGVHTVSRNLTLTTISPHSDIRYTTDGTEPTESSTIYTGAISLPVDNIDEYERTIKAKTFSTAFGWEDSEVKTNEYKMTGTVQTPVLSPDGGTYTTSQSVTITCATNEAEIRYTTNGTEPTRGSTLYSSPITLKDGAKTSVKAKAFRTDWIASNTASSTYTIDNIPAPTITPNGGVFDAPVTDVTITTPISGATIRYTLDGTEPTGSSAIYSSPMTFAVSRHLVAKVFKTGLTTSLSSEKRYIIGSEEELCNLEAMPPHGVYNETQFVALTCPAEDSVIRFEINDPEPDMHSNLYETPLEIAETTTLKAIAYKLGVAGYSKISPVYTIDEGLVKVDDPVFDPPEADFYANSIAIPGDINITTATAGATIFFTTDGSEPSEINGYEYGEPVTVLSGNKTVKAKAVKDGMADSETVTANYRIIPVFCTGQDKCYNNSSEMICSAPEEDFYGQDAQYAELGYCIPKSYTVSGTAPEEIVTDNNTGLQWQRTLPGSTYTWQNAINYCSNLTYGGHSDWRLPSVEELETLVDYGRYNPAIDTDAFPGTPSSRFWSSSSYVDDPNGAWHVDFGNGYVDNYNKTGNGNAGCVR
jgi:hypothetical protein